MNYIKLAATSILALGIAGAASADTTGVDLNALVPIQCNSAVPGSFDLDLDADADGQEGGNFVTVECNSTFTIGITGTPELTYGGEVNSTVCTDTKPFSASITGQGQTVSIGQNKTFEPETTSANYDFDVRTTGGLDGCAGTYTGSITVTIEPDVTLPSS